MHVFDGDFRRGELGILDYTLPGVCCPYFVRDGGNGGLLYLAKIKGDRPLKIRRDAPTSMLLLQSIYKF